MRKKITLSIILLLTTAALGFAQDIDYEKVATRITNNWNQQLKFSENQQKTVYNIILKHVKTKAEVSGDKNIPVADLPDRLSALDLALDKNMGAVLTEEQKANYSKFISERRNKKVERTNKK